MRRAAGKRVDRGAEAGSEAPPVSPRPHVLPGVVGPSRREVLLSGLATMAACAAAGDDSAADTAGSGAVVPGRIDHVIFLMMENRSFDHVLGSLSLLEGRVEVDGLAAGMSNPDAGGVAHVVRPTTVDCVPDPPHGWTSSHDQFNGGANDGFVVAYARAGAPDPGEVMAYLTRDDAPISYALADQFAVCHAWHASVMGPTWPNRFYAHAGTSDGQRGNDLREGGQAFTFPTVWHKLEDAGVDWKYYYSDIPFLGLFDGLMPLGKHAFVEDFLTDVAAGALPAVSWIEPGFTYNDDHPPHHVGLGQEFLARVVAALGASPLWERCLLVVTYDEHGGFFDHVPPPTTQDDHADEGFDQVGFRVPALLVGPWVRQGPVEARFDHASWLKYVCELHGIAPWTARIVAANSVALGLDAARMARGEPLPAPVLPPFDLDDASIPPQCFGDVDIVSLDVHGEHVRRLAEWGEARHPGTVRLDISGLLSALAARP